MVCDLAVLDAEVMTMNPDGGVAEAFAVTNGKVVKVGSNVEIGPLLGPHTKVLKLNHHVVTPGLIDTHTHFSPEAVSQKFELDLRYPNVKSISEMVERVRERARSSKKGEWIRGRGWSASCLRERRDVTRRDLDPASPDNPVILVDAGWHAVAVNTLALKIAGIDRDTVIDDGRVDKEETGEPNGVLHEKAAGRVRGHVPFWSQDEVASCMEGAQMQFISEGVTCIKDACNPQIEERCFGAYRSLLTRGKLRLRVCMLHNVASIEDVDEALELGKEEIPLRLWLQGVKLFMDGGGAGNIWLWDDFNTEYRRVDRGNKGYPQIDLKEYEKLVRRAASSGLSVDTHAVGDRAIDEVVEVYSRVGRKNRKGVRFGVVHCYLPTEEAIRKMAQSKGMMVVETQPAFLFFNGDSMASYLGPGRSRRLVPLRRMLRRGITVGLGSDWAGTPPAPRFGIWSSVTRKPRDGLYGFRVFGTGERVTREDALRCYTSMAARCLGVEDMLGSIEAGKLADFVVWGTRIDTCTLEELKTMRVVSVYINGLQVYPEAHPTLRV